MKENEEILKIEDLIDGEIYCFTRPIWNYYYIAFYNKEGYLRDEKDCYKYQNTIYNYYSDSKITKPNSKQKHWLNECIKADKFIPLEEAIKTFIEEDKIYDITKLTPYPEKYKDCKKGDKVVLVNYTSKTSNDAKIPLGSVLTIDQDNNSIPFVLYKEKTYCVTICQVAPIPNEEQKEESLVGRYVQSIKKYNNNNPVGSYDLIVKVDSSNIWLKKFLSASTIIGADHYFYDFFKLMPIGWSPEQEKLKEELPEYVEYIETQFKGQIVKIEDWTPHAYCKVIFSDGTKEQPFKHLVKESTKEDFDKQELLKEAKKKYPNGSKVKSLTTNFEGTINWDKLDSFYFEPIIQLHEIYLGTVETNGGTRICIYNKGEWAKIIEEPKKEIDMKEEFKKGDYIVTLISSPDGGPDAVKNYCFKQRCDSKNLKNVLDIKGNTDNGNTGINFSDKSNTKWRYATEDEIKEYDLRGEPYDTSILNKKQYDYEVVHCENEKEFNFVKKKLNIQLKWDFNSNDIPGQSGGNCINFKNKNYCRIGYYKELNSKICTFSEWCKLNNYVMEEENWIPKEKELGVSLENKGDYRKKGDVFQVLKVINKGQDIYYQKDVNGSTKTFRKALPHEIPNNQSNQTIDIGDEVNTSDGNGIVIGINEDDKYLVKGINNINAHNGHPYNIILKKGNFSNQKDSYYYLLSCITLIKKANSNIDISRELGIVQIDTGVPSTTNNILQVKVRNKQIESTETKQRVRVQLTNINKLNLKHKNYVN